jgi:hypothetical protein
MKATVYVSNYAGRYRLVCVYVQVSSVVFITPYLLFFSFIVYLMTLSILRLRRVGYFLLDYKTTFPLQFLVFMTIDLQNTVSKWLL